MVSLQGSLFVIVIGGIMGHDFMPNGSLDDHLFGGGSNENVLSWDRRHNILVGVASALHYLHDEYDQKVGVGAGAVCSAHQVSVCLAFGNEQLQRLGASDQRIYAHEHLLRLWLDSEVGEPE